MREKSTRRTAHETLADEIKEPMQAQVRRARYDCKHGEHGPHESDGQNERAHDESGQKKYETWLGH
jgi:hypothetical protein